MVSLHHTHWLGFADGIASGNADGTRAFAFEFDRGDDSYSARGRERSRTGFAAARASSSPPRPRPRGSLNRYRLFLTVRVSN